MPEMQPAQHYQVNRYAPATRLREPGVAVDAEVRDSLGDDTIVSIVPHLGHTASSVDVLFEEKGAERL